MICPFMSGPRLIECEPTCALFCPGTQQCVIHKIGEAVSEVLEERNRAKETEFVGVRRGIEINGDQ